MNERIREFEKQATEIVKCGLNGTSTAESFNRKKFAELIVRECAQICQDQPNHYALKTDRDNCAVAIKEHFGVK
jgi:hypothetical protein